MALPEWRFRLSRRVAHMFGFHHDPACRGHIGCAPRYGARFRRHWYR